MSITYSSKGTPVLDFGSYKMVFTNTNDLKDNFKWVIVSKGGLKSIVPISLEGLKTKIAPIKTRNQIKKILVKYGKDGTIKKSDIESIHKDLQVILGESVIIKINRLLDLIGN